MHFIRKYRKRHSFRDFEVAKFNHVVNVIIRKLWRYAFFSFFLLRIPKKHFSAARKTPQFFFFIQTLQLILAPVQKTKTQFVPNRKKIKFHLYLGQKNKQPVKIVNMFEILSMPFRSRIFVENSGLQTTKIPCYVNLYNILSFPWKFKKKMLILR